MAVLSWGLHGASAGGRLEALSDCRGGEGPASEDGAGPGVKSSLVL